MTNFDKTKFVLATATSRFARMKRHYEKCKRVLYKAPTHFLKQLKEHELLEMEMIAKTKTELEAELRGELTVSARAYREDEIKLMRIQSVWGAELLHEINLRMSELLFGKR